MRIQDLEVTHRYIHVNGLRMHYVEKGQGPLIVLLHGFPEMWWSWRYQINALVDAGFRVIAPDLRGYNETEKKGPYDVHTLTTDVAELIQHESSTPVVVVGHDWGGLLAWNLAAYKPELCSRVVVMNCPHLKVFFHAITHAPRQMKRSWYMFFFLLPWLPEHLLMRKQGALVRRILRGSSVDKSHFSNEDVSPYREAIQKPGAANAMLSWYRTLLLNALSIRSQLKHYPSIRVPTLLIWGKQDRALGFYDVVPGTERFVESLRVEALDDVGHFVQAEAAERVNTLLLEFISDVVPQASLKT